MHCPVVAAAAAAAAAFALSAQIAFFLCFLSHMFSFVSTGTSTVLLGIF